MDEERKIREQLALIDDQRRELDRRLNDSLDMLERQRVKKMKLFLKDECARLQSLLLPDIMA